jgi:hypothetical protein
MYSKIKIYKVKISHLEVGSCLMPALIIRMAASLSTCRGFIYLLGAFPARVSLILE